MRSEARADKAGPSSGAFKAGPGGSGWPACSAIALAMIQWLPATVSAQTWRVEPSIKTFLTATNNSGFANSTDSGGDVVLDLIPRVALTGRGARFTVNGSLEADSLTFARNTQSNQLIPSARVSLNGNPIEQWLYVDAAASVEQSTVDPYSVISTGTLPSERLQTTQYRLSPYLDHAFSPLVNLQYRNNNVWTRRSGEASSAERRGNYELHANSLSFSHRPVPLGFSLETNQEQSRYTGDATSTLDIASARVVLTYAADPTVTVGVVAGKEQSEFAQTKSRDKIRGLRLRWLPTERSDLNVSVERRFFDTGWAAAWSHRSPFVAMSLNLARTPTSQPASFVLQYAGGDLRSLIDAAFTTRYPNPVERAVIVDNAVANLGGSVVSTGPIEVYSNYAQLQTRAAAQMVFLGRLSTLTVQVFTQKAVQLQRPDTATPVGAVPTVADNEQIGVTTAFNRRLTSTLSVDAVGSAVRIEGLGAAAGQSTTSQSVRLAANQALSPKTRAILGGRLQHSKVNQQNLQRSVSEIAGFFGIEHRF